LFVLPETLTHERRARFEWRKANPVGSLKLLRSHPELFGLAMVIFLCSLAHEVLPQVSVLYAGYRYNWNERDVGFMLAGVGVCAAIVQGGLVQPAVRRFGERTTLLAGLMFGVAAFAIYGLAATGTWFWMGVPVMSLWGLSGGTTQGLMTRRVQPSEQGQLQGANSSVRGIAGLFGPGLFTLTFAGSIGAWRDWNLPGAAFLLAALLLVVAVAVAWRITKPASSP
jgi:DHA1 family tetracycline resistance protein-like MFS transporter